MAIGIGKNFAYYGVGGNRLAYCRRKDIYLEKEEIDLTGPDGNGVVSIGPDCFNGFINLKRIKLPNPKRNPCGNRLLIIPVDGVTRKAV